MEQSTKLPFMSFYPRDWLADVGRLDFTLRGVYHHILCLMWTHAPEYGTPQIPDDDDAITALLGVKAPQWQKWKAILTAGNTSAFLRCSDGWITQKRLTQEWGRAMQIHSDKSKAGQKGMVSRWGNSAPIADDNSVISTDNHTHSHPQSQTQKEPEGEGAALPLPPVADVRSVPKKEKSIRATTYPDGFEINASMADWFRSEFPKVSTSTRDRATAEWRDACLSKRLRYVDWTSAWRNGMRHAEQWGHFKVDERASIVAAKPPCDGKTYAVLDSDLWTVQVPQDTLKLPNPERFVPLVCDGQVEQWADRNKLPYYAVPWPPGAAQ